MDKNDIKTSEFFNNSIGNDNNDFEENYVLYINKAEIVQFKLDKKNNKIELISKKIIKIERDNRFFFSNISIPRDNKHFKYKYELVHIDEAEIKKINSKYYYVSKETLETINQDSINKILLKALVTEIELSEIRDFLDYQLEKYRDKKKFLEVLEALFSEENNFNLKQYSPNLPRLKNTSVQTLCKNWCKEKLIQIKSSGKEPSEILSYRIKDKKNGDLEKLFELLIKEKCIDKQKTIFKEFKKVFSGVSISSIKTPIYWIEEPGLLAYFIDSLFNNERLYGKKDRWLIAKKCFTNSNNVKQASYNYKNTIEGKPKRASTIDKIIVWFPKPPPSNIFVIK
ncbi:MAG: hypothetical protein KAT48_01460 [Bacteroidales bacterium]|nr:hypothetical protein [Bacteroidales bacterium]